ncbi:hypothetical protein KsCSTR_09120 [Candidatus Kuenenia stuttgartiensis]|uniref:Uncharacterized protein n=1 Tax=Kuenenia stuttgartiensis TaxID=174633 RepID=Q1PZ29_KUEST|nr:hypothetical protein KsCSTR_09120 [Candidatus Kuenenia stuttgartiensis]CAJ72343.1 unknown protein [Candidatus Kuenenia stuttgartiensis]
MYSRFFVTSHFSRMKREYRTAEQGISNYEVFLSFDIHFFRCSLLIGQRRVVHPA